MTKGLPRSLSRGPRARQEIVKQRIAVDTTVTVAAVSTAIGFGSAVVGGLPEGNLLLLGVVANLAFAGSGSDANLVDDWEGDFGLGSTPADDATISGTDVDLIASTAIGPATGEAIGTVRATNASSAILDNTADDLEMNLNLLVDAADITDDASVDITVTGDIWVVYTVLGDD